METSQLSLSQSSQLSSFSIQASIWQSVVIFIGPGSFIPETGARAVSWDNHGGVAERLRRHVKVYNIPWSGRARVRVSSPSML